MSWAVYFAASLALVGTCSPVLAGVSSYSCGDYAAKTAQGSARVFDSVAPGMVVAFSFRAPSPDDHIVLGGRSLTAEWCGRSSAFQTSWLLPTTTLSPGVSYHLRLTGNQVEVSGFV